MKVAIVTSEVRPGAGGRFTFQQTLAEAVQAAERHTHHRFLFISRGLTREPRGSRKSLLQRGISHLVTRLIQVVRDLQDRALGIRIIDPRTGLERRLDAEAVDLVWFTDFYAEECDRPFIFTIFDLQYLEQPWFPEVSRRGQFESRDLRYQRYVRKATRVIVPNAAGSEQVQRYFAIGPERVLILPHPTPNFALETQDGPNPAPHRRPRGVRSPYLVYPAQFWPHKNHTTLLHALVEVNARSEQPYQLVCVGTDKGSRGHVEAMVDDLGLGDDVLMPGFVELEELIALYRHAHALVYLSWFGPENMPPLEAFALGCPVVQADVPGARDQVGDAALLVSPERPDEVADAVLSLEADALRSRLVEAGRRRAMETTPELYVAGVIDFLDQFEAVHRCWA